MIVITVVNANQCGNGLGHGKGNDYGCLKHGDGVSFG
jgi:hypothetical protein